jgi:amino acid adenylation domain-containing protein
MKHESVQDLFTEASLRFKDQIAIERLSRRMTYAELEDESNRLANYLINSGVTKGSIIAILVDDSIQATTAIIATLKAGGVFVPLDADIPKPKLQAMVTAVTPGWYITAPEQVKVLNEIAGDGDSKAKVIYLDRADCDCASKGGLQYCADYRSFDDKERPTIESAPDDMCYIYFTSGSTGQPKGIAGRLKAIDHFIRWEVKTLGIGAGVRVSQFTTPSFDAFLRDIFVPLCMGGTVCVPDDVDTMLDSKKLVDWIDSQRINLVHCVPSLFRSILNENAGPEYFKDLKYVLMAGEPVLPSDVRRWADGFGDHTQLVNLYGPSETTMTKFFYFIKPEDRHRQSIPIGKPMEGARAILLDEKGEVCPPGAVGEIYIRTPYRTHGYYKRPDLTNLVFIQNPFSSDPDDIVYKTGDLSRMLEDGNFEFLGRKDRQVKIRGVRIELAEIEDALRIHDDVKDVAVVDLEGADGGKYLCAYVVVEQQARPMLRDYLARLLPAYMVPSAFVTLDELPRTISGKIDRGRLPQPAEAYGKQRKEFVAPRTPFEEAIAGMWCQVLGLGQVSIFDNFFELGGHSLLATQVLSRVRAELGVDLSLRVLFESPTVEGMALAITQMQAEEEDDEEINRIIEEIKLLSEDAFEPTFDEQVPGTETLEA